MAQGKNPWEDAGISDDISIHCRGLLQDFATIRKDSRMDPSSRTELDGVLPSIGPDSAKNPHSVATVRYWKPGSDGSKAFSLDISYLRHVFRQYP